MVDVQSTVFGALAVLAVLGVAYFVMERLNSRSTSESEMETAERIRVESDRTRGRGGPTLRGRAGAALPSTKLFYTALILTGVFIAYQAYTFAKTGSPNQTQYAAEMEAVLFGVICASGGMWMKNRQDNIAGELQIAYEGVNKNTGKTVYYEKELVEPVVNKDGDEEALLVPALKSRRLLGLFWRPLLVGDCDDLRDADQRLPNDRVIYRIPLDESSTTDQHLDRITVRAERERPVADLDSRADYELVPSDRKSQAEIKQIKNRNEELESDIKHLHRKNGQLSAQLRELDEMIENEEHHAQKQLEDALGLILPLVTADPDNLDRLRVPDQQRGGTQALRSNGAHTDGRSSESNAD